MKTLLFVLLTILQISNKCPKNPDGKHKILLFEKCNHPGCGGYCECKAFKEYTTEKWFPSKDSAINYIKKHAKQ